MKLLVTAGFVFLVASLHAQFRYTLDATVPVSGADSDLKSAWSGGLNAAQYNTMDIDLDGDPDLIVYERTAAKIFVFLQEDGTYIHAPEYELLFPDEIANWVLLRDYDGDGWKDLFTGNLFGIRVFRNVSSADELIWEPVLFGSGSLQSEVLLTRGLSGMINLQLQFDDLPSIGDADGDGDLDIFAMDFGGTGRVEFHRNYSIERHGSLNHLEFELVTKSWGDFAECDCAVFAFGNEPCGSSGGRVKHQGGKSLLAMDTDGDGNQDLLLSEAECDKLSLLPNNGTIDAPVINTSELFPSTPAQFPFYPAPYFEDVDFDNTKDLVVSSNLFARIDPTVNFKESNWFYKNTGTDAAPVFQFGQTDFLQSEMIDVGDNAVPALGDLDGDGDLDLFLSTNQFPSSITVYENTGSLALPEFVWLTDDYLNLSSMGFANMKIQIVDINMDGARDLAFTASLGTTSKMYYFLNAANDHFDFSGSIQEIAFSFSISENLHLTDIDNDGKIDIFRGRNTGALEFWRNSGNLTFTLENPAYLGMAANPLSVNPIVSAHDLNADGRTDLILADHTGQIRIVSDYRNAESTSAAISDVVFNPMTESYYAAALGGRIWPTAGDLFQSGKPAIIAGTGCGGVRLLKPVAATNGEAIVSLYPNPVNVSSQVLNIDVEMDATVEVYSVTGGLVLPARRLTTGKHRWDLSVLANGMYIFRVTMEKKTFSKRVVVQ